MNCPKCGKVLAITKIVEPTKDAVTCIYCAHVIPAESLTWEDGRFHFRVIGDVTAPKCNISPRVLMEHQDAAQLDLRKLTQTAIQIINRQPNLRCVCGEFMIDNSHIRVELLDEQEFKEKNEQ